MKNGEVYLNERILNNPDFKNCNLITIEDKKERNFNYNGTYSESPVPEKYTEYNFCLNLMHSVNIYDFAIINNGALELHLLPSHANVKPKRAAFKLCDIKENEPIEVRFNLKFDTSGSRNTERTFVDEQYIFLYLGKFNHCTILKYPFEPIEKHLPVKTKMIDLLKPLW